MFRKEFTKEQREAYNKYHRDYSRQLRRAAGIRPVAEQVADKKAEFLDISTKAICKQMGITPSAVAYWTLTDEAFRQEYERLKQERVNNICSFLYRVGTNENIKVSMPNVTAAIFMAKNLAPKEFGERYYREEKKSIKITREEIIKDYGKVSVTRTRELTQGVSNVTNEDTSIS